MTFTPPWRAHVYGLLTYETRVKDSTQIIRDDSPV